MHRVVNATVWAGLIAGVWISIQALAGVPPESSRAETRPCLAEGRTAICILCRQHGRDLPEEIDETNLRLADDPLPSSDAD